jgi:hypothetical protein
MPGSFSHTQPEGDHDYEPEEFNRRQAQIPRM